MVLVLAAGVRGPPPHPADAGGHGRGAGRGLGGGDRLDVPAPQQRPRQPQLADHCARRHRPDQLHVPLDGHPGVWPGPRRSGGVRVATMAIAGCRPFAGRLAARRARLSRRRHARLHRRSRDAHGRLRLPMAARPRHPAVCRRCARRRTSGGHVVSDRTVVDAAGRDRQAQLRDLPVALADLRVRRGLRRFGGPGCGRPRRHGRGVRAVLPLRGVAGTSR